MTSLHTDVQCQIIPFPQRSPLVGLTSRDRIEVSNWHEDARQLGFDRLVIHERESFDPPETGSFLSVYRTGQAWSSWGIMRRGASVQAWCSKTGADVGPFPSISDALMHLLSPAATLRPAVSAVS
jgi:hypothetical protein